MLTTKPRSVSMEVPQKISPTAPRTALQLKASPDSDSISSPKSSGRMPKGRNSKVSERVSPRTTAIEKKHTGRIPELETQVALLQDELKKMKDQLISTEKQKRQAQMEAEETEKQLAAMSAKLEESQQLLLELSDPGDARFHELRKVSHDQDQAWESKLEFLQKRHSFDSTALASARNEIRELEQKLDQVVDSETKQSRNAESAYAAIQSLRLELSETLVLLEEMKHQLNDCKESEARALEVASEAKQQLEAVKATAETLRSDGLKAMEAYKSLAVELEQSNAQVSSLEMLVKKLQEALGKKSSTDHSHDGDNDNIENHERGTVRAEIDSLEIEVGLLKTALEASENRYRREYIQSRLEMREAFAEVECAKAESAAREAQLKEKLRIANSAIKELKSELVSKTYMNKSSPTESELELEHRKLEADLEDLKASLMDKEAQLQFINEENEMLKMEVKERVLERSESSELEKAEISSQKAAQIAEKLGAAQTVNTELEAQLRRLKVQTDQWRKAAEAAAAMLSPDSKYHTFGAKMGSPFSDEMDDDSPKKRNGNVLKKIGVFLMKGNKEKHQL